MRRLIAAIGLAACLAPAFGQVIPVYSGVAPGSEKWTWSEETRLSTDQTPYVLNIVKPTITVYPAAQPNGTGALVVPGGGFRAVVSGKEGEEIARWLNAKGITAFVLKYRLARTGDTKDEATLDARAEAVIPLAVDDARTALRIIDARKAEWGLKKLGVIGFSAGGLLAVATASGPVRPDFVVPVYAAAPREIPLKSDAPPAFIVLADDDRYGTDWSLAIYKAWRTAHVPAELHIYAKGNHGFALRKSGIPTDSWPDRLSDWMKLNGFVPADAATNASPGR